MLIYIAGNANQSSWAYITMEKFQWDERMVGMSLGWVGLMVGIVQGGLTRIIIPKLGQHKSVFIGLLIYSFGFLLFAFATQGWMMFAFMSIFAFGGIAGPSLQSLISSQVPANEQGEIQGTLASLVSLTSIIGPLLMNNILFHYFSQKESGHYFPGAPFLMGAFLTAISAFLAYKTLSRTNKTMME
jgi:DHA1 family tetracycline resistance protein-like MFS transporter